MLTWVTTVSQRNLTFDCLRFIFYESAHPNVARSMSNPLVDAAQSRDEQARAAFASLQALDFIGPDDLACELLALTSLRCGASEHAPPISACAVGTFLQELGPGVPERYDEFVTLHNRLVHWALREQTARQRDGGGAEPTAEQGGGVGRADDALRVAAQRDESRSSAGPAWGDESPPFMCETPNPRMLSPTSIRFNRGPSTPSRSLTVSTTNLQASG